MRHNRTHHELHGASRRAAIAAFATLAIAAFRAAAQEAADGKGMKTEAVLLWAGLVILAVVLLGLGLMWGVARGGRLLMRQRKSKPMDTRDIWFLNPPEKKRPPRGDDELHDTDEIEDLP